MRSGAATCQAAGGASTREEAQAGDRGSEAGVRLMVQLMYGVWVARSGGLPSSRVKDVDFGYLQITVRAAKGAKDRVTMLPVSLVRGTARADLARVNFSTMRIWQKGAEGYGCRARLR